MPGISIAITLQGGFRNHYIKSLIKTYHAHSVLLNSFIIKFLINLILSVVLKRIIIK